MSLGLALGCLLGLGALAYLLLPIVMDAGGQARTVSAERSELEDLYIQREGMYSTLKELDFDFETGKLTEEDYRELRARYSDEAVRILQRIEEIEKADEIRRAGPTGQRPRAVPPPQPGLAGPKGSPGPSR